MKRIQSRVPEILFFVLWTFTFLYLALHHIPWRDEYQSWLVSTRTDTFSSFLEGVRYERHPPLLYLLERGAWRALQIFGMPSDGIRVAQAITWSFSVTTVALIVFFTSWPRWMRFLIPLSYFFIFEYGVISRCYIIGVFFLFTAVLFWKRERKVLSAVALVLTASTHLYLTWLALAVHVALETDLKTISGAIRKLKSRRSLVFMIAILLLVIFQIPPRDTAFTNHRVLSWHTIFFPFQYLGQALVGLDDLSGPFRWNRLPLNEWSSLAVGMFFFWMRQGFDFKKYAFFVGPLLFVMTFGAAPSVRHTGLLWIALLILLLIDQKQVRTVWIAPILVLHIIGSGRVISLWQPWGQPPGFQFSGWPEILENPVAVQIGEAGPNAIVIAYPAYIAFPLMSETMWTFYDPYRNGVIRYPDFRNFGESFDLRDWCAQRLPSFLSAHVGKSIYLATPRANDLPDTCPANLIFESQQKVVTDEAYRIYQMRSE